jgi:hypothetical protein
MNYKKFRHEYYYVRIGLHVVFRAGNGCKRGQVPFVWFQNAFSPNPPIKILVIVMFFSLQ